MERARGSGMKVHTGTHTDTGLVHTLQATAANVARAGVTALGELLHGAEESLHGNSAHLSQEPQPQAEAAGIAFNVNQRGSKHRPLTQAQHARNRRQARQRAVIEHPFLVVKRLWGHTKVHYRGLAKNLARVYMLYGSADVYRERRRLMST